MQVYEHSISHEARLIMLKPISTSNSSLNVDFIPKLVAVNILIVTENIAQETLISVNS